MITDREMGVVWLQGIFRSSEKSTSVVSMVFPGKKIRIVADLEGTMVGYIFQWKDALFLQSGDAGQDGETRVFPEDFLEILANLLMKRLAKCCKVIQSWLVEDRKMGLYGSQVGKPRVGSKNSQVKSMVPNRYSRSRRLRGWGCDDAKRYVGKGEM